MYFGSGAEWKREKPYGLSKYMMDQVTQNKNNIYNLRLYSVYGPGTDWRYRFINNACAKALLGMPIKIPRIGRCDYMYINDLCRIVEYYIHNFKTLPKSSDICSGKVLSPEEIINHIKEIIPIKDVVSHDMVSPTVSRSLSCKEDYFGNPVLINDLPFALTSINDGIKELLDFYSRIEIDPEQFVY